jgi:hypothetical protein
LKYFSLGTFHCARIERGFGLSLQSPSYSRVLAVDRRDV